MYVFFCQLFNFKFNVYGVDLFVFELFDVQIYFIIIILDIGKFDINYIKIGVNYIVL